MISTLMWASNSALMAAYDARCAGAMGETRGEASSKPQRYLILSPPTAAVQQTGYEDRRPGAFVRRNSVVVPSIWKHSQMSPPSSVGIARVIHAKYGREREEGAPAHLEFDFQVVDVDHFILKGAQARRAVRHAAHA